MKRSLIGKRIKGYLDLAADVRVGEKYVDFAMKDDKHAQVIGPDQYLDLA